MSEKKCLSCGASISLNATECKYCGQAIYGEPHYQTPHRYAPSCGNKNKVCAGVLAILLGGLGIHKFYLGKTGLGIVYLIFCWTYIPTILGIIEGIIYLTSSDEKFYNDYARR